MLLFDYLKKFNNYSFKKLVCIFFLSLFLNSCKTVYIPDNLIDKFYVDYSENLIGMQIRNGLISYFPNRNIEKANYKIQTNVEQKETLFLASTSGFSTKGNATAILKVSLLDIKTNNVVWTYSKNYVEVYDIDSSAFNTKNNKQNAYNTLVMHMVDDIYDNIFTYLYYNKQIS